MPSSYEVAPHLSRFQISRNHFLCTYPDCLYVVVGAYIFSRCRALAQDGSSPGTSAATRSNALETRVLVLERSLSDSYGGWWEGPSGTCEESDGTILDSLVREVHEESGLRVSRILDYVATETWSEGDSKEASTESSGSDVKTKNKAVKVSFLVDVNESTTTGADGWEHRIKLAPEEHEQYQWATESEVRDGTLRNIGPFKFGGEEGVNFLKAFEVFRDRSS